MRSLLKYLSFVFFAGDALSRAVVLEQRADENITLAAPIIAVPSIHWEGIDGRWSTFTIRVGTPESGINTYRVLPATSLEETWVVYGAAAGVCNTTLGVKANCAEDRGGVFDSANSPTWTQTQTTAVANQFELGINEQFGYEGVGQYGFDTVGLGFDPSQGPTLPNQVVSQIVSNTWWFGQLGMSFEPVNFTSFTNQNTSFAESLFKNGSIASRTWSYTAGAVYRIGGKIFGSLIFGGYDASRFVPNNVRFNMNADNSIDLTVNIRSMVATTPTGNTTLLSSPVFAFIDSTVPEFWLPTSVCKEFEKAFGLKLNDTTGTYLLDEPTHKSLLSLNPSVTITLGNDQSSDGSVDITLPYGAFDVNISAPIYTEGTSYYFPLMATDDTNNYRLGRTFLQEAYVTANYHTRTFNVSQCIFDDGASAKVIAIPSVLPSDTPTTIDPSDPNSSKPAKSSRALGGGAIAGIVIGVLAVIAVAGGIIACCLGGLLCFPKRHKDSRPSTPIVEADSKRIEKPGGSSAYTSQASAFISEVSGKDAKVEIQGNPIMRPQELEADVPMPAGAVASDRVNGPSDSSRGTADTGVSSMSPVSEYPAKTPMAELGAQERGLGYGTTSMGERVDHEHVVSPNSPTIPQGSLMGRENPQITVSSPTISEATWTPTTPVQNRSSGSRFEERFN